MKVEKPRHDRPKWRNWQTRRTQKARENSQIQHSPEERKSANRSAAPPVDATGQSRGNADAIETALADAITKAAAAGAFDAIAPLVAELDARRKARLEVVDLDAARRRREPKR